MLFTVIMSSRKNYSVIVLVLILISTLVLSGFDEDREDFSEIVKVSLRDVGHRLLLSHQDSTSLVLPVVDLGRSRYALSFQESLSFKPNDLVSIVKSSFEKAGLPLDYRVEVINCTDLAVAYSYEIKNDEEKNIIPCAGRLLPENCYIIEVQFTNREANFDTKPLIYVLVFIAFVLLAFLFYKRKEASNTKNSFPSEKVAAATYASIGSYRFYPEQNKLVKATEEIALSRKECELLEIFVARPNQIIKRDELSKRVWEDNGVIVGRSLDTYISKLRKKLKDDASIKLTNVHGVGYKLEV